jgi:hypothetical protein
VRRWSHTWGAGAAGALLVDNELQRLPREVAYSRINGVCNLSSEAGNLGTFYITNIRVVWFSNASHAFNVSIPYVQVSPAGQSGVHSVLVAAASTRVPSTHSCIYFNHYSTDAALHKKQRLYHVHVDR